MANSYTQIYVHFVFVVKGRDNLISKDFKDEIYKYITGIVTNKKHKLIAINGMPDHIHILVGINPVESVSELIKEVKRSSSLFINEKGWMRGKFSWQSGYGAFSYSHSQIKMVARYIENQENHHKKRTFKEEYIELLEKFEISYENKYVFDDVLKPN